jgi:hypothetical protein
MEKTRWYTPQLSRKTIARLYAFARVKGVAMTKLADALITKALDEQSAVEMPPTSEDTDPAGN